MFISETFFRSKWGEGYWRVNRDIERLNVKKLQSNKWITQNNIEGPLVPRQRNWKRRFRSENVLNALYPHLARDWSENATNPGRFGFVCGQDSGTHRCVFKMFSVHTVTQSRHFQLPPVWRAIFQDTLFYYFSSNVQDKCIGEDNLTINTTHFSGAQIAGNVLPVRRY